ncbi:conjugal transfer protein TraF [Marinomonas epiphytica]
MKKSLLALIVSFASAHLMAAIPVYQPVGTSYTLGTMANKRSLSTSLANPAAPYLMTTLKSLRHGYLGPIGFGYEMGSISNLEDQVDELEDTLSSESYSSTAEAEAAIAKANGVISDIADTAYIKFSGSVQLPFMPLIYKSQNRGAFMLDSSVSFVGKGSILADDINYSLSGSSFKLNTDTSMYIQSATDFRVGLGYSQVFGRFVSGALVLGGKINFHEISLGRDLAVLVDDSSDAGSAFGDDLFNSQKSSTGLGLDLGALWVSDYYQLGATLANINEPEFDYETLGDCGGLTGSPLTRCNAAVTFSDASKLSLVDSYTMERQLTLEGALTSKNRQISLAASFDVNAVADPIGDEYQWQTLSVSYFSDNIAVPGVRLGYRKNAAGEKLSYVTAGATLFQRLNLDLAYGLESLSDEGGSSSIPRSFYFSLGYDSAF